MTASDRPAGTAPGCGCEEGRRLTLSRRSLFKALGGTALVGATLGDVQLAFGATPGAHVLVTVVLSGGMDGLTLVPPLGDPGYAAARPVIAVPPSAAMTVDRMFGLHPALAPLYPHWRNGTFGVVHAVGQEAPTRSHFEAMEELERAAPTSTLRTGWLDRTLGALPMTSALEAVALGDGAVPGLLRGEHPKLAAGSLDDIRLPVDLDVTPGATWRKVFATLHADARPEVKAPLATLVSVVETLRTLPEPKQAPPPPPPTTPPPPPPRVTATPVATVPATAARTTKAPPVPTSASGSPTATAAATAVASGSPSASASASASGSPSTTASPTATAATATRTPPVSPSTSAVALSTPAPSAAAALPAGPPTYPESGYGHGLRDVARLIKADVGLRLASVSRGGWDYHTNIGPVDGGGGTMAGDLGELANGLAAFAADLGPHLQRVTVVTLTEFGRRVEQNGNNGLDHGHGCVVLMLGGGIRGGKVHGTWPTLAAGRLDQGDLAATTDYRTILAEILTEQMGVASIADVFPGLPARRLGVVAPR